MACPIDELKVGDCELREHDVALQEQMTFVNLGKPRPWLKATRLEQGARLRVATKPFMRLPGQAPLPPKTYALLG